MKPVKNIEEQAKYENLLARAQKIQERKEAVGLIRKADEIMMKMNGSNKGAH